jgi:hypothetical protein
MIYNDVQPEHLGGGVIVFRNAITFDFDWACQFAESAVKAERDGMYREAVDPESGEKGFLNKSGYFFKYEDTMVMPRRGASIHRDQRAEVKEFLEFLEKSRDRYLLKYLCEFPLAYKNIWWKVKGHLVAYSVENGGRMLGPHSDTSADYAYGFEQPSDQLATRNTLTALIYFNDGFSGGDHYFNYLDIRYTPNRGDIMMFPSNYMAAHEVELVTSGNRYSYLGWYAHGSPNQAVNEFIADPITQPDLAAISTNVYMPTLRDDFRSYLEVHDIDRKSSAWHLVESMHS